MELNIYCIYWNSIKGGDISMSPRTGRPPIDKPKNNDVKVRFDDVTHSKILVYCEKNRITKAEFIRQAVELKLNEK